MAKNENEKVRIELRFDPIKDKDIIEFIDKNGSTRAGFVKSLILQYKNSLESNAMPFKQDMASQSQAQEKKAPNKSKNPKKKAPKLGQSFSSNDFK